MYLLLRVNSRRRWQDEASKSKMVDDAPVALVADFRVIDNGLSLYLVDQGKTRALQIAVALAATRDKIQEVDYVLLDEQVIDAVGLSRKNTKGAVPDQQVVGWHQDLMIDTVTQLRLLIVRIWQHFDRGHLGRVEAFEVKNEIIIRIQDGRLDRAKVNPKLLATLESN